MRKLVSLFFVFTPAFCFAQTNRAIDSLEKKLGEKLHDTERVVLLDHLAMQWVDIDPAKSLAYANRELELAVKMKDEKQKAFGYLNIGNANYNLSDYKTALQSYINALHIQETIGNKKGIASASGAIGNVYLDLKKPDESIKYFERTLAIFNELGSKRNSAAALLAIGNVYSDKKEKKKALDYYFQSLKIFRDIGDKESEAVSLNNIAQIYGEAKEYVKSLEYVLKALVIDQQTGNVYSAALTLNNIGDLYHLMGDDKKAVNYYQRGWEKSKSIGANDRMLASYKGLASAYKALGDYKLCIEMQELAMKLNDTIFNTESSQQIAEMQAKFDAQKKEKEITVLTKDRQIRNLEIENTQSELKKQRVLSYSVIAGLALMVLLAFFIFRGYRQKQKANLLLEEKNALIEEKNKSITDSINYASRIQQSLLPSDKYIDRTLKRLINKKN